MSQKPLPIVDEAYAQRIFSDLGSMEVVLDGDPLAHGPKRMNAKIAVCRNHLDRCQQIYLQMSNDLHSLNRAMRSAKVEFDLRMQDMLTNDPETRAGRSVRDREAIATMKLRDEREAMATIESAISDLDAVMIVVKAKRDDLKDTLGRIRDQLKLCQEEIGLGGRWGSAPAPGQAVPPRTEFRGYDPTLLEAVANIPSDADVTVSDLERFVQVELTAQGRESEISFSLESEVSQYLPEPPAIIEVPLELLSEPSISAAPAAPAAPTTPAAPAAPAAPTTPAAPVMGAGVDSDFDAFLSEIDSPPVKNATTSTSSPPASSEIDLDDLIGSFS